MSDVVELGNECFASQDGLVISYRGENYYKACSHPVTRDQRGAGSFCVKRVGHISAHEDWHGEEVNNDE